MRHFSDASLPRGVLPWQKLILAYVLGIWALKYPLPGLAALLFLFLFIPFKTYRLNSLVLVIFLLSFALAWFRLPEPPSVIPEEIQSGDRVVVTGQVMSVAFLPGHRQRIILEELKLGRDDQARELPGRMVWTWKDAPMQVAPGQLVQAHLNVRPVHGMANFGVWNSEFFWRTQKVFWRSFVSGERFWHKVEGEPGHSTILRQTLKEKALSGLDLSRLPKERKTQVQGLGLALFFGDRYLLDQSLIDSIRLASLAHTLALSGLHLGIMAGMGFILAGLVGLLYPKIYLCLPFMKLGILLATPLCLIYIWMGQAPPTLIRSGIMFASWGLLLFLNQKRVILDGLFMATAIITLMDPWSVFDLRLQLSIAAVAGIALVLPILETGFRKIKFIWDSKLIKYFLGLAGVTLAANLALFPVQAWTFNYVSPHLYLNLFWLPVLGFVVLPAGFSGLFISLVPGFEWLGRLLLNLSGHSLNLFVSFLEYLDYKDLLHPIVTMRPAWQHVLAFWLVTILVIYCWKISFKNIRHVAGVTLIVCLVIWPLADRFFESGIKMRVLDVGQGQGIILELPGSKRIMVDGGGSWNPDFDLGKSVVVPSLTWKKMPRRLNRVILSHAHVDHYGGLIYPLTYLGAEKYVHGGIWPGESDSERIRRALIRQKIPEKIISKGDSLDLGRGIVLETVHPQDVSKYGKLNDTSLVLRLLWHGQSLALIPGDIESQGIEDLLATGQDIEAAVIVMPHHGSRTSACTQFYERVSPEIAVVSRGFMNRFGVPHAEALDIISNRRIEYYDTAVHGETVIVWKDPLSEPEVTWARNRLGPRGIPYWY